MIPSRTLRRATCRVEAVSSLLSRRPAAAAATSPSSAAAATASQQVRRLHHVPPLTHDATFREQGISGVLSPGGFDMAWSQYQGLMVEKLNVMTAGTANESIPTKTLLLNTAREPDQAALFNHASMAHNNHFFFNCLSPRSTTMPSILSAQLAQDFSSLDTLKAEFLATATAMFGPGFVWLVKATDQSRFHLLTTYLAGSPYPGAHYRRQPVDMATQNAQSAGGLSGADYARQTTVQNAVGAFGPRSRIQPKIAPGGVGLTPVLCVNTWEHVWLRDWGIGGKRAFLEAWWERVDWGVVANNADVGGLRRGFGA